MVVYITTNLINGKQYIGQDSANNPYYKGSGLLFSSAVKKYGGKNFKKEILAYAQTKEELNELEIYYIKLYNAKESKMFYNITDGGTGGIVWNPEKCHRCKKIYEIDILTKQVIGEFESGRAAAEFYNIDFKNVSAVLHKKKKSVSGKHFVKEEDIDNIDWDFYIFKHKRANYTHTKSGKEYYDKFEMWKEHYTYVVFESFKTYTFKTEVKKGNIIVTESKINILK